MAYTKNPTWQDYDGTDDTLITAAKLNHLEDGVEAAAATADAASQPGHAHAGGDITTGTVAAARLPVSSATASGIVELATTGEATTGTDTTRAVTPAGVKAVVDALSPDDIGAAPATQPVSAKTAAYTLVAGDAGKMVEMNLSAGAALNVPGSVFTAGQRIDVLDVGSGRVTFVGTSGMTLNGVPSLVSSAQWSAFSIFIRSATTAAVIGRLA